MTGDVGVGKGVGYPEHAAASGPRESKSEGG